MYIFYFSHLILFILIEFSCLQSFSFAFYVFEYICHYFLLCFPTFLLHIFIFYNFTKIIIFVSLVFVAAIFPPHYLYILYMRQYSYMPLSFAYSRFVLVSLCSPHNTFMHIFDSTIFAVAFRVCGSVSNKHTYVTWHICSYLRKHHYAHTYIFLFSNITFKYVCKCSHILSLLPLYIRNGFVPTPICTVTYVYTYVVYIWGIYMLLISDASFASLFTALNSCKILNVFT